MPPIYLSLGSVQPFADMEANEVEPGVKMILGDGKVVGLLLEEPRLILRLPDLIEAHGLDADRVWNRLRGDVDIVGSARAATWGGHGA